MYSQKIQHKIQYYLLLGIAFSLPLSKKVVPILIILIVLNWLISGDLKSRFSNLIKPKYAFLFISFYLLHLTGLIYTSNMEFGWFDMEVKLSFLIFPLVFFTSRPYSIFQMEHIKTSFIGGCLISGIILLVNGFNAYFETGDVTNLLYGKLSMDYHASYYSMYLCLALAMIMHFIFTKWECISSWERPLYIISMPVFLVLIVLLMAKSGFITLVFVIFSALIFLLFSKKFGQALILFTSVLIFAFAIVHIIPESKIRINKAIDVFTSYSGDINPNAIESTAERLLIWPVAMELIKEHPLIGVGTGDIKDELISKYKDKSLSGVYDEGLNAHNQFLQTFAALGIFGFLSMCLGLVLPLVHSFRQSNFIYAMLIMIIIINALTESILEVQAGVIFYAFFNSLFMFLYPDK